MFYRKRLLPLVFALAFLGILVSPGSLRAQTITVNDNLNIVAQVGTSTPVTTPTPSGSGGGGGYYAPTAINFSGRAYPLSRVTVLKDGIIAITTIAGPDARFSVSLQNLSEGSYTFSVYSEDSAGRRSTVFSFPLYITYGATTDVSGIFIAPTIDVNKLEVKYGDNINIFGVSVPSAPITISVHSDVEHIVQTQSDSNGVYLYTYNTAPLELGGHDTKSKAQLANLASEFGKVVSFTVGNKNIIKESKCDGKGDLNHDCRVNLVDFSILAYWYKRPKVPVTIDLNGDHTVSIVDFSILAYYWTG